MQKQINFPTLGDKLQIKLFGTQDRIDEFNELAKSDCFKCENSCGKKCRYGFKIKPKK